MVIVSHLVELPESAGKAGAGGIDFDAKPRVFVSTSSFGKVDPKPLRLLTESGVAVRTNPFGRTLTEDEAAEFLKDVDGVIAGTEPLTRRVLAGATRLKAISRCGTGVDNVDLDAAAELGIAVRATQASHVAAVAELTVGAMIALLRQIPQNDRAVRRGVWEKRLGGLLQGRTVGVVGLGKVGKAVVRLLRPFDVKVLAYDTVPDWEFAADHGVRYTELDELLQAAEIVTLHLPYRPELRHLLDRGRLFAMRPGAYLINTSRGGLVDEEALCEALHGGRLAGAFIDTFENEPYRGPLLEAPGAILSPHAGAYARESRLSMEIEAVQNLLELLRPAGLALSSASAIAGEVAISDSTEVINR